MACQPRLHIFLVVANLSGTGLAVELFISHYRKVNSSAVANFTLSVVARSLTQLRIVYCCDIFARGVIDANSPFGKMLHNSVAVSFMLGLWFGNKCRTVVDINESWVGIRGNLARLALSPNMTYALVSCQPAQRHVIVVVA